MPTLQVAPISQASALTICFHRCEHLVCLARHNLAKQYCSYCKKTIGYQFAFVPDPEEPGTYLHSQCLGERTTVERLMAA
jgi:hypothetical protein